MKTTNALFVISTVFVPLLLLLLNYSAISDYYSYSVPLNKIVIDKEIFSDDPDIFQKTLNKKDSTCFTTLNDNFFCYEKPRVYENSAISYVRGFSGIQGELHFDPVDTGVTYFTIQNMTLVGDDAIITLADMDYSVTGIDGTVYSIDDDFQYSTAIEKFDTFVAKCNNFEGTVVTLVQYLGVITLDGKDYFATWHTPAHSDVVGVTCNYPEIIEYSLKHNFGDL